MEKSLRIFFINPQLDFYGSETIKTILSGVDGFNRWGFGEKKGELVAKIYGSRVIIKILKRFLNEEVSEIQAARMMNDEVDALQQ